MKLKFLENEHTPTNQRWVVDEDANFRAILTIEDDNTLRLSFISRTLLIEPRGQAEIAIRFGAAY